MVQPALPPPAPCRLLDDCCHLFPAVYSPFVQLLPGLVSGRAAAKAANHYLDKRPRLTCLHDVGDAQLAASPEHPDAVIMTQPQPWELAPDIAGEGGGGVFGAAQVAECKLSLGFGWVRVWGLGLGKSLIESWRPALRVGILEGIFRKLWCCRHRNGQQPIIEQ